MNKETKLNVINLDLDMGNPLERGMTYGYVARVPLDLALIVKICKSNLGGWWKYVGCTCVATDIVLSAQAVKANLPKLMKK